MVITVIVNLANVVAMLDGLDCVASNCPAMPDVRNTVNARMVPAYVHKDGTVDIARYRDAKTPVLDTDNAHWKKDFINASVLTDGPVLTAVFYWRLNVKTIQIMTMTEWSIAQTVSAVHILDVRTISCAYPAMILWKFYFESNHLPSLHRFINELSSL